ncbi:hypothetical protein MMC10_008938 [Thelotrema lepadinum]|nr:hypothetical protein [Thelotrema lepadinum]
MPYMLARYKFVGALREIDTRLSVQTQKHHLMEMLRLSGFDNMDLRPLVPGTILRLGQEQECYDFMKRTQTALNGPDFMVDASKPPWASIQGCNSFEPLASFCSGGEIELPFKVGLTLVKIRLLLDLLALRAAKAIAIPQSIPPEILTSIRAYVLRTKIVADKHKDKSLLSEDRADETASLKRDIETLWAQVREEHKQMWQMLLHPARHLDTPPVDDQEQPQLSLLFTHKAYEETPYALGE